MNTDQGQNEIRGALENDDSRLGEVWRPAPRHVSTGEFTETGCLMAVLSIPNLESH